MNVRAAYILPLYFAVASANAAVWMESRQVGEFVRAFLPDPSSTDKIRSSANLAGPPGGCCITGWVEYDFTVPLTGWYELSVQGNGLEVEYLFNPDKDGTPQWYEYGSSGNTVAGLDKIANFWLTKGHNSLRLQRYYWTGFPRMERVVLRQSDPLLAHSVRAVLSGSTSVFRARECPLLQLYGGGLETSSTVSVEVRRSLSQVESSHDVTFPASSDLQRQTVSLPCQREGDFLISFRDKKHGWFAWRDMRGVSYQVIGRATDDATSSSERRALVKDIDIARTPPDYSGGGPTQVTTSAAGLYRESGMTGFTLYQRASEAVRRQLPEPSWFAYTLEGLTPQHLYEIEVEYPDDSRRTVAIALREDLPLSYPVSGGFDTGGEFFLTHHMQKHALLFWPRSQNVRAVVMNVHDAQRAAASRIRVFERDSLPPSSVSASAGGRDFLHWYEEGDNFFSLVGTPEASRHEWRHEPRRIGVERWLRMARSAGASMVAPTVSVYSFSLYPSRYNRIFSRPDSDDLRRILLLAEKHSLQVIPELHPRADELDWPFARHPHPRPHLLLSREGQTNFFQRDGKTRNIPPHFNPLHPLNQDWYVGMIGELADRYKDSPAFKGISLRLMPWANASLNNFSSLDWGYDDFTVALFSMETGILLPNGIAPASNAQRPSPLATQARFQWLTRYARETWIAWRCRKIVELYTRIRDRLRVVRPDLVLYSTVFAWSQGDAQTQALREAGIDAELLSRIDGVTLINAQATYGRREPDDVENQRKRALLLRPYSLAGTRSNSTPPFLTSANYVEATEAVIPPEHLGLPSNTKRTWVSAAVVPSGAHLLERFAIQLARTDALILGDGGNGYSFGQPLLRDWLREYRALPAKRFQLRPDMNGSTAVWTRSESDRLLFYAVNTRHASVKIRIEFSGEGSVKRLTSGERLLLQGNHLDLTLAPFQVLAYVAAPSLRMSRAQLLPSAQ